MVRVHTADKVLGELKLGRVAGAAGVADGQHGQHHKVPGVELLAQRGAPPGLGQVHAQLLRGELVHVHHHHHLRAQPARRQTQKPSVRRRARRVYSCTTLWHEAPEHPLENSSG